MKLSLIIPCFNEQDNICDFYNCVTECFKSHNFKYECIFINDGSSDNTLEEIKKLLEEKTTNIQVISFSRNFGKESAIYAGLTHSKGEMVCIIDADLQQSPDVVLEMINILETRPEVDCVAAYQKERKETGFLSAIKSCFYNLINYMSDVEFVNGASDFRLMRRQMVNAVLSMSEYHRFSKGIFSWVGFNTEFIPYEVNLRQHGESKWNVIKLIKYALDGIIAFSTVPLKMATIIGFISSLSAIMYLVVVVIQKLSFRINVPGYTTTIVLILLVGGLILFSLGIIGEYLARIYVQVKNRPIYIEKEHLEKSNEKN